MFITRTCALLLALLVVSCTPTDPEVSKLLARKAELEAKVAESKEDWESGFKLRVINFQLETREGKHSPEELCRYQMKCLGTAAEMESTKQKGRYPDAMAGLVPSYFDTIPSCPSGVAYEYKVTHAPREEYDFTCPTHGVTYNSLAGFQ